MNTPSSSTSTPGFGQLATGLNQAIHDLEVSSGRAEPITFRQQRFPWASSALSLAKRYQVPLTLAALSLVALSIRRSQRVLGA